MLASLYVINIRRIFKAMQLFKLNALTLLLMIGKKHKRHVIIENFENREFCCLRVIMIKDYNDRN